MGPVSVRLKRLKHAIILHCHLIHPERGRTSSFCNVVDSELDDSMENDLQEIDRLVANANAGKCQIL